jgi:hypothetical protein
MLRIERIDTFLVDLSNIRPRVMSMATMHGQTIVVPRIPLRGRDRRSR